MAVQMNVNGRSVTVTAATDTPLFYVLSNELQLRGPRFGCGLAQCGSCSVLVDGVETRSCVTPVSAIGSRSVTTLEGLPVWYAATRRLSQPPDMHPVQQALLDEQSPQCGYCYNGMIVKAAELLSKNPKPDDGQILSAMNGHLCRCGTYPTIQRAIRRASEMMSTPEARR
jgi:aerobic-type carbon monoxide dehydrogenase small subunit (CoxS/CutS family)